MPSGLFFTSSTRWRIARRPPSQRWWKSLTDMLRRSLQAPRPADWNESLIHAAFELVTKSPAHPTSTNLTPDLKTALGAKKLMSVSAADQTRRPKGHNCALWRRRDVL